MSTQVSTLDKLHLLESLYRQGYQSDVIDRTLDKAIALENAQTRQELQSIKIRLNEFEEKFQMNSTDFQHRFHDGELGDEADFFEWSAFYDMAQNLHQRLQLLETKTA